MLLHHTPVFEKTHLRVLSSDQTHLDQKEHQSGFLHYYHDPPKQFNFMGHLARLWTCPTWIKGSIKPFIVLHFLTINHLLK
ncbi:hypothetical protein Hanom_Chr05g00388741 [Helianthus anomalus]